MDSGTCSIKYKAIPSGAKSTKTQDVVIKSMTNTPIVKSPEGITVSQSKDPAGCPVIYFH